MARRDEPVKAGFAAAGFVALVAAGAGAGLLCAALADPDGVATAFDRRLAGVIRFTLLQAILSTVLSVLPAIALALALNRNPRFPGRALLMRLFALPLALPAIVAALGVLALYGRAGVVAGLAERFGGAIWPGIYGLAGILIAHVFFNLPLATRLLLSALAAAPANHYRLAAQLGMGETALLRFVEWPLLRSALPGVALMVLMLCLTSFTIVLLLGGGPAATTLEVEIYQSLRFDFDPARAGALVAVQVGLTAVIALFAGTPDYRADSAMAVVRRPARRRAPALRLADTLIVAAAALFVGAPLVAIVASGLSADFARLAGEASVHRALASSLILGVAAGLLAVTLALALASARKTLSDGHPVAAGLIGRGAMQILAVPTTALGAGWFLLINRFADPAVLAPVVVITINAAMALPFAFGVLRPQYDAGRDRHDRLAASLGIAGLDRWRRIDWPVLRRPLASAFAFAVALSLGDLGVIALFGSDTVQTLPWLVLARMGAYRTADAAGLALLLAVLCLVLMAASDRMATEKPA